MAAAVGQTIWRSVAPSAIESELADVWKQAAASGPVSRALMSNLVIVSDSRASSMTIGPESAVLEVARRHPARTLLLNYSPGAERACAPAAATVGVVTFGEASVRYGVEVIAVEAACAERSIPSIVRGLIRGDVPTTVWWTGDLSERPAPAAIVATGRQLLYDSGEWRSVARGARAVATAIAARRTADVADLNWRRLSPLRHAIVHALTVDPSRRVLGAGDVRIQYSPGSAASAWLLGAWFACRLKWGRSSPPAIEEARLNGDVIAVTIGGGGAATTASLSRQRVKVKSGAAPAFRMTAPRETTADAVVAELQNLGHDACLRDAVVMLAGMAQ